MSTSERRQVPGVDFPAAYVDEATGEVSIIYCPYVPEIILKKSSELVKVSE